MPSFTKVVEEVNIKSIFATMMWNLYCINWQIIFTSFYLIFKVINDCF